MYRKQLARVGSNGQGLQAVDRNSKRRAGKEISRQEKISTERDWERWGGIDGSEREQ